MKRWERAMIAALGCLSLAMGWLGAVTAMAQEGDGPPGVEEAVELKVKFDWEKLDAQALEEYAQAIRPGSPGKSAFWGKVRRSFKYAQAFDFLPVEGAKSYRFTITQWDSDGTNRIGDKAWSFEAAEPWAPLTPVWTALPVSTDDTRLRLTVEGLDKKGGKAIGASTCRAVDEAMAWRVPSGYLGEQYRDFRKGQPFAGPFYTNEFSLHEGSLGSLRRTLEKPMWAFYKEHGLPIKGERGPEYAQYANLGGEWLFAHGWLVARSMASLARETKDRDEAALAITTATNGAETVINTCFPADWKYAFCPSTLKNLGSNWRKYLTGEITYERFFEDACNAVSNHRMEWEARANDPGQMYLDMYDVTKEEKYLRAAKRLAQTYRTTQLPSGTWYDGVNPKTGEPANEALHPPALIILFLDRLASQYGILDYQETADRAFRWLLQNRIRPFNFPAKFWEDTAGAMSKTPHLAQGSLAAAHVAICLFNRAEEDPQYVAMGEEIVRFVEDQFVFWKDGRGYVSEQYRFMKYVGVSGGGVLEAFWRAFEATGKPLYLAKALALANTVVTPDDYGNGWNTPACAGIDVLEFCAFLKKHGLPGAE